MQFPGKLPGIYEIKHSSAISQQNSTKFELKLPLAQAEDQSQKAYFSVQFPGKLPGISKIKHISDITGQNSTKLET